MVDKVQLEGAGGWSALAESPRLGIVLDEHLVWSAADGGIGRPFARVFQALALTHVETTIVSQRPPAVVELLQRSNRGPTWVSTTGAAGTSTIDAIRTRLSGIPLVVIRATADGQIQASAIDATVANRMIGGSMAVLDLLWWISRRRGVTRASTGSALGPRNG